MCAGTLVHCDETVRERLARPRRRIYQYTGAPQTNGAGSGVRPWGPMEPLKMPGRGCGDVTFSGAATVGRCRLSP